MRFRDINLRKIDKETLIKSLKDNHIETPSKKELKEIQRTIADSIEQGIFLKARNSFIFGIYFDFVNTFVNIQRKGLFRYSKYVGKMCIINNLAIEILEIFDALNINAKTEKTYLDELKREFYIQMTELKTGIHQIGQEISEMNLIYKS